MPKITLYAKFLLILSGSLLCLSACGKEESGGISERLSGPEAVSALPMRIDATVTPTATEPPSEDGTTAPTEEIVVPAEEKSEASQKSVEAEKHEPSELEIRLSLLTPTPPQELQEQTISTRAEETLPPLEEAVLPTPEMSPTPKITPTPEPEPTSTATPQPSPTPKPTQQQKVDSKKENTTSSPQVQKAPAASIKLNELVICSTLAERTPSGVAEQFSLSKTPRVYTWMRISGATPPMRLKHRYYREGKFVTSVSLKIKYSSMRTWSQKTFKGLESQGRWKVVVTTEDEGTILAEKEFTLVP